MHSLVVGSKKLKILLALALWYYMVLHTTIGKRRSGAFKQKKVYQNRTIIKEVISKNVIFLLALVSCSRSRYWYYMVLHTTIGKRRSGAFKQKKVYQNGTIIKEVISKNVIFLLALAPGSGLDGSGPGGLDGSGPGGWTGLDRGAGPRWYTQCYFSNFLLTLGSRPGGPDPEGWT